MPGRSVRLTGGISSAGKLTHHFTIHAPAGTLAVAASDVAEHVPMQLAAIELSQQLEYLAAGGIQASATYIATCRYREDLRMDYVLVEECHNQRRLQILSMVPTEKSDWLNMICGTSVV